MAQAPSEDRHSVTRCSPTCHRYGKAEVTTYMPFMLNYRPTAATKTCS